LNSFSRFFYHFARLVLGVIFIYASLDKISHPQAFAQAVFNYQILPDAFINLIALVLPWLELISGCCLVLNKWIPGAVFITTILLISFISAIFFNLSRGLDVGCGCFSTAPGENVMSNLTLLRDLLFLGTAAYLFGVTFFKKQSLTLEKSLFKNE